LSVLENPRHERFAQELAKGKSATEAMAAAGYSDPRNSTRMTKNDEIRCRVAELQSRAAERAVVTIESLILEVEEARKLAMRTEQPSAAISAIREKGIISGKRIERSENAKPGEFDAMFEAIKAMTPEQRRARAAELVKQLVAAGVCDGEGRAKD
jgi:phage terminase small subunit